MNDTFQPLRRADDPYLKGEGGNCGVTRVPDGATCPACWRRAGEWHQPRCPNDSFEWLLSGGREFVEAPTELLPEGVSASSFDPDTLRARAEMHNRHPFDHDMKVKAWVVLWLLDHCGVPNPSSGGRDSDANA